MDQKFAGLGLTQILVLWLVLSLITIGAKVLVNKYQPNGLTELVNTI
jgi:hypothetical protein